MKVKDLKYLTNTEIKALNELKRKVLELEPSAKLILFGSKARGDFDEESDIDVLIIVPELNFEKKEIIWDLTNRINLTNDTSISSVVIDRKKFNTMKSGMFISNVKAEGILI